MKEAFCLLGLVFWPSSEQFFGCKGLSTSYQEQKNYGWNKMPLEVDGRFLVLRLSDF